MSKAEKRKQPRKKVGFTVTVTRIIRGNEVLAKPSGFLFIGTEISAGGMGIETDAPIMANDLLSLNFNLPGEKIMLALTARVLNMAEVKNAKKVRLGIRFEGLSQLDQTYLSNYIGTTFLIY